MSWDSESEVVDFVTWEKAEISREFTKSEFIKLAKIKKNKIKFVTFKNPMSPATPVKDKNSS